MNYRVVTVYREERGIWTNEVPGINRELFAKHESELEAVEDGKVLSEVLGIPYGAAESERRKDRTYKKPKKTRVAPYAEKVPCPETRQAREAVIRELEGDTKAIDAIGLAKLGLSWPPKKGWRSRLLYEGW